VATVVVRVPLGLARPQGECWRRALRRLDLRLLVHAQHQGTLRRGQAEVDHIATLSTNAGSEDSLKVSARCGRRPKARQIRNTVVWLMPARRAIARVLQCVALRSASSSVRTTRCSTASSPMLQSFPARPEAPRRDGTFRPVD
jgi:hypothetical protein